MSAAGDDHGRDKWRHSRRRPVRARTIPIKRITRAELEAGRDLYTVEEWAADRATMAPCRIELRANGWCPLVSCKHHLYLDSNPRTGSIKLNFPDLEVWELRDCCSLEIADRDGVSLDYVGKKMNLTRERTNQVLEMIFENLRNSQTMRRIK